MNRQRFGALLLAGAAVSGLITGAVLWGLTADAPLSSSVQLAGYSLAGVRPSALGRHLERLRLVWADQPVVVAQAPTITTRLKEWGVELDVATTQATIIRAWQRVPLWQRLLGKPRLHLEPQWAILPELFQAQLERYRFLERAPVDARVSLVDGQVVITPSQDGRRLDLNTSTQNLIRALRQLPAPRTEFELAFTTTPPRLRTEDIQSIRGIIASYTTRFSAAQRLRTHNLRLAANALNGIVLLPGERLSYNQVVGKRTAKRGFQLAPVIINGEKQLGIGGGVCQVSSTLFNAALLSDLSIVRRANHAIPVDYVPLGRDATVVDGAIDLVIENPFDHPIAIATEVKRSTLTVHILGVPREGRRIVLRTERYALPTPPVKHIPDPSLPEGMQRVLKKGSAGFRVVLWREAYEHGQLVKRERVAISTYRAQPRVVAVGTKPRLKPTPPETPQPTDGEQLE